MKKYLLSVSFIFIALFICTSDVFAYHSHKDATEAVANGSAVLLCEYYDPDDPDGDDKGEKIYYHFKEVNVDWKSAGFWDIFYKNGSKYVVLTAALDSQNVLTYGLFQDVFYNNDRISYNSDGEKFPQNTETNFKCPAYSFTDFNNLNEICFGDYKTCGENFEKGPFPLQKNGNTIFEVIDKYAGDTVYDSITQEQFLSGNIKDIIKNKTLEYTKQKYAFGTTYDMPAFIASYIDDILQNVAGNNRYKEIADKIKKKADQDLANGDITQEQHDEIVEKTSLSYYEVMGVTSVMGVNPCDDPNCYGLLGIQMTKVVNNVFTFVQFAGPLLVVILTTVDFIKAAAVGTQEEIRKSSQRFVKRVIAAMALFFVPLICSMLFDLAGVTVPENCIGTEFETSNCTS